MAYHSDPKLAVDNKYYPGRTRYPLVNYAHGAAQVTGVYKYFQAIVNDDNVLKDDAQITRVCAAF